MSKKKKRKSLGQQNVARVDFNNIYKMEVDDLIGVCGDPHLGSKYDSIDELELYYDILDDMGVRQVYNAGDLSDGNDVYRGQHYEQKVWGFKDHTNYIVKNYPKKSQIKTFHIAGNHDTSFIKKIDANIGEAIASRRLDMPYLGEYYARIKDEKFNFDLVHLRRGRSYAVSYPLQTFLRESLNPNYLQYPQLVASGHRHQNWIGQLQSVWCCEVGHFQKPTPYTIEKGIISPRGGFVLDMEREGPNIYMMKATFIQTDKRKPGSKYRKNKKSVK